MSGELDQVITRSRASAVAPRWRTIRAALVPAPRVLGEECSSARCLFGAPPPLPGFVRAQLCVCLPLI